MGLFTKKTGETMGTPDASSSPAAPPHGSPAATQADRERAFVGCVVGRRRAAAPPALENGRAADGSPKPREGRIAEG